jgi:hypothetical protein
MSVVFPLHLRSNKPPVKIQAPQPIVKSVPVVIKPEEPKPVPVVVVEIPEEPKHAPFILKLEKPKNVPVIAKSEKSVPIKIKTSRFGTANYSSTTNFAIHP